jgi:hypothetical protein
MLQIIAHRPKVIAVDPALDVVVKDKLEVMGFGIKLIKEIDRFSGRNPLRVIWLKQIKGTEK